MEGPARKEAKKAEMKNAAEERVYNAIFNPDSNARVYKRSGSHPATPGPTFLPTSAHVLAQWQPRETANVEEHYVFQKNYKDEKASVDMSDLNCIMSILEEKPGVVAWLAEKLRDGSLLGRYQEEQEAPGKDAGASSRGDPGNGA